MSPRSAPPAIAPATIDARTKAAVFDRRMNASFPLRFKIRPLPANHSAIRPCSFCNHRQNRQPPLRFYRSKSQSVKRQRQQRITRQNRHRFAEHFVVRWLPAAQIVVIQRRQVIMDQRIGVNKFQRAADLHRAALVSRKHPRRFHAQNRPDPFPARKHTVAHRLMNGNRQRVFRRHQLLQRRFYRCSVVLEEIGDCHSLSADKWKVYRPLRKNQSATANYFHLPDQKVPPQSCHPPSSAKSRRALPPLPAASGPRAKVLRPLQRAASLRPATNPRSPGVSPLPRAALAIFRSRPSSALPLAQLIYSALDSCSLVPRPLQALKCLTTVAVNRILSR